MSSERQSKFNDKQIEAAERQIIDQSKRIDF